MQPSELFVVAKPNVPRIAFCAAADLRAIVWMRHSTASCV
jgi:hypothetical protein